MTDWVLRNSKRFLKLKLLTCVLPTKNIKLVYVNICENSLICGIYLKL